MTTARHISALLAAKAQSCVKYLFTQGSCKKNYCLLGSVQGNAGESLRIELTGDNAGLWYDFATGEGGDLLDLWRCARNLSLAQAIHEARQWLGVQDVYFFPVAAKQFERPAPPTETLIVDSPAYNYLTQQRRLTPVILERFKIVANDELIFLPFYRDNKLIQLKRLGIDRPNGKKQIFTSRNCEPCLFGWQAIDPAARSLVICEGEIDAMSLAQYGYNALSVPFGGGGGKKQDWVQYEFDNIAIYDEIYLCFDDDPIGEEAVADLLPRLGQHRCKVVKLPYKDANTCLQANVSLQEIQQCFDNAISCDPKELKSAHLYAQQVIDEFNPLDAVEPGVCAPFACARDKIRFRPNELSLWTGINGHGKSQFLGQIILHSMKEGAKVCVASLELKPVRLLMRLTRQAAALPTPSDAYIRAIHEWYRDKLWLFDLVGTAKTTRLLEVFLYAHQRYGVDVFVIDSLMKCGLAEDDYNNQKLFVEELCDFKNRYNVHVHLVAHPRKSEDETKRPGKLDIKGTGTLADLADNCFTVWRNKAKEEKIQITQASREPVSPELLAKYDGLWGCDKQRNGEWEGKILLWFDKESCQYLAYASQRPIQYVNFSTQGA